MATTLTASVTAGLSWTYTQTVAGFSSPTANQNGYGYSQQIANGTGAFGQADKIYAAVITLAGGATTILDLATGLNDFFGANIVMARVKFLFVALSYVATGGASSIAVGNATHPLPIFSAGATTIQINNGGIFLSGDAGATGIVVTAGVTDSVKILNNDGVNSATVNFAAIGSST